MTSTSEIGHAKNLANLNLLNTNIIALASLYNPSNPQLELNNLQSIYTTAFDQQNIVNSSVAPYSIAVDNRELIFKPLGKKITKLRKAYKATEGVTQAHLEDFMTVARKIKGIRKITNETNTEDYSVSQLSYDQRTNNMDLLISLLQNTQNYSPKRRRIQSHVISIAKNRNAQDNSKSCRYFRSIKQRT